MVFAGKTERVYLMCPRSAQYASERFYPVEIKAARLTNIFNSIRSCYERKTIFSRIIDGEIPSQFIYQDELCVCVKDIAPQAPVHLLIIPRKPIPAWPTPPQRIRPFLAI